MLVRHIFSICFVVLIHGAAIERDVISIVPSDLPIYEVSLMTYIDPSNMSFVVRQHIQIENKTRHIYISPLALFDVNQITMIPNPITHRTTMIIPLILYTDEQIKFIHEHNSDQCKQRTSQCLFHEVSTDTMRVIYKHIHGQTNSYHRYINSIWISYNSLINERLLYVNIDCISKEICLKLLHRSSKPIGLHLEYAIQNPEQHHMVISDEHLLNTSSELILERDIEQFLYEIFRAAGIRNNEKYVLSQIDLFLLKQTLRKQLIGKSLILTTAEDKQWNSVYWNNNLTRPDRIFKQLKKKKNSKCLLKNVDNIDMDNYVRRIYDQKSFDLYLKNRHLFQLDNANCTKTISLKLKPILAYELKKFDRSKFRIHQLIHMTKREDIHSIPIRFSLPLKQMTNQINNNSSLLEEFQRLVDRLVNALADCKANKHQLTTTDSISDSSIYESTENQYQWMTDMQ